MIFPDNHDRRTRVAVKGSYVGTALEAVRRAVPLAADDTERNDLTAAAVILAQVGHRADIEYADLRQQAAQTVSAALEG